MALIPDYADNALPNANSSQILGEVSSPVSFLPCHDKRLVLQQHHTHASSEYSAGIPLSWELPDIPIPELLSCKLLPWTSLMGPFPEGKAVDLSQPTERAMKLAPGWGSFHRKWEQRQNELITAFTQCQVLKEFNWFSAIGLFSLCIWASWWTSR